MRLSRRAFLAQTAALAAAGALPAPARSVPPRPGPATEYGFSFDASLFQTGFPSRAAAAAAAAIDRPGEPFSTAEVAAHGLAYPDDLGVQASEWLMNGGRLGNAMADWMAAANEDGDYEGEFADACNAGSRLALGDAGRAAVAAALGRAGAPGLAALVLADADIPRETEIPEPVFDALAGDAVLAAELSAAIAAWAESENLERELRGLQVSSVESHAPGVCRILAA